MPDFLGKSQVQINPVAPERVQNLGNDLLKIFGSTNDALKTYNQIGETAALVEYRDTAANVNTNIEKLKQQSLELAPDDVEGHQNIYNMIDQQRSVFTNKLADFSGHTAAYDKFAEGAAVSTEGIERDLTQYKAKVIEATQLKEKDSTTQTGEALSLSATPEAFTASLKALEGVHLSNKDALSHTQNAMFNPAYANMVINVDSQTKNIEKEVLGEDGYPTLDKIASFGNEKVLQNYPLAKLVINTDDNGNKTLAVDSPFTEEQNAKIVGLFNQYLNMKPKAGDGSYPYYYLKSTRAAVSTALASIKPDMPPKQVEAIYSSALKQFDDLMDSEDAKHVKLGDPQLAEFGQIWADIYTSRAKQQAIYSYVNAGKTLADAQAGGLTYEVKNSAQWIFPNQDIKSTKGQISPEEFKASYKYIDVEAQKAFQNGDVAKALLLSRAYISKTEEPSTIYTSFNNVVNGRISPPATVQGLSGIKTMSDIMYNNGEIPEDKNTVISRAVNGALSQIKDPKSTTITPDAMVSFSDGIARTANLTFGASQYEKKIIDTVKNQPWFSTASVNSDVIGQTVHSLIVSGKMRVGDDPTAVGKLVYQSLGETVGGILIPSLDGLDKKQLKNGMDKLLDDRSKKLNIEIPRNAKDLQIRVNSTATGYVVQYRLPKGNWSPDPIYITPKQLKEANEKSNAPIEYKPTGAIPILAP
jgi:hypothetical protein